MWDSSRGEIDMHTFTSYLDRFEPLMPESARDLEGWQATQTVDNTMTAAPFATHIPVCLQNT